MPTFDVEVIHETTGTYMNFTTEIEDVDPEFPVTEENAWDYIMDDLSIIVSQVD
jgi:hypothetical protein